MSGTLLNLEKAADSREQKHKILWELRFLRQRLVDDAYVLDLTLGAGQKHAADDARLVAQVVERHRRAGRAAALATL